MRRRHALDITRLNEKNIMEKGSMHTVHCVAIDDKERIIMICQDCSLPFQFIYM